MAPSGVVPAFDVVKHSPAGLDRRAEPLAIEQLTLECREETLAQGIVIGIADGAHRRPDAETQTALAVGEGCVLGATDLYGGHLAYLERSDAGDTTYLPEDLLMLADKMTMAASLEL